MPKSWYEVKNKAEDSAEISIYDEIGLWGVSARHFASDLKALGDVKNIDVSINSLGGSLFDGIAMYNMLKRHPANVRVFVDGIAASAASIVAMAGDEVVMPENAFLMIHNITSGIIGTADEMREYADVLDKMKTSIVSVYRNKTGIEDEKIAEMISSETWLSSLDAVAMGFADTVSEPRKIAACLDRFENPPEIENLIDKEPAKKPIVVNIVNNAAGTDSEELAQAIKAANPGIELEVIVENVEPGQSAEADDELDTAAKIAELCNEAGVSMIAASLIKDGATIEQAQERIKAAAEIRTICNTAKLPDRANEYIKAGLSIQEVRASLFDALAARDMESETNPWHQPTNTAPAKGSDRLKAADIYAKRQSK